MFRDEQIVEYAPSEIDRVEDARGPEEVSNIPLLQFVVEQAEVDCCGPGAIGEDIGRCNRARLRRRLPVALA